MLKKHFVMKPSHPSAAEGMEGGGGMKAEWVSEEGSPGQG